jgi:shikimate kinase/3-dehydroquinate synthase
MPGGMIFLYGPSGSGKGSVGKALAGSLRLPFVDLDEQIVSQAGRKIPEIFTQQGETGFRKLEKEVLFELLKGKRQVIALGGGTLLDAETCQLIETKGRVFCLSAPIEVLLERLEKEPDSRPLLAGDRQARLRGLLAERASHYASFTQQIDTSGKALGEIAWELQVALGTFHVQGMGTGYDVQVCPGGLDTLGERLVEGGLRGPVALVSDTNIAALYGERVCANLQKSSLYPILVIFPAGEQSKNLQTISLFWERFLAHGLERGSTVIALGGGVTTDLAGFAAAAYLRGIPWVAIPTSLLGMVDASLGGKTGFDLPQGKNLVGFFNPPRLVLADPFTLQTLPAEELSAGMAEVLKAGIIADPALFHLCARGWELVNAQLDEIIRRAMAVKVRLIQEDPYEQEARATLNLGHTIGHALELASGYRLSHGEAVAVGMVLEARLAERLGMARKGMANEISSALSRFNLPVSILPGLDKKGILEAMQVDKKKHKGDLRFALPVEIGKVQPGIVIKGKDLELLQEILEAGE